MKKKKKKRSVSLIFSRGFKVKNKLAVVPMAGKNI
jgi:hypothetical protein